MSSISFTLHSWSSADLIFSLLSVMRWGSSAGLMWACFLIKYFDMLLVEFSATDRWFWPGHNLDFLLLFSSLRGACSMKDISTCQSIKPPLTSLFMFSPHTSDITAVKGTVISLDRYLHKFKFCVSKHYYVQHYNIVFNRPVL